MVGRIEEMSKRLTPSDPGSLDKPALEPRAILSTLSSCHRAGMKVSVINIIKVLNRTKFKPMAVFLCLSEEGAFLEKLRSLGALEVRPRTDGVTMEPFFAHEQ